MGKKTLKTLKSSAEGSRQATEKKKKKRKKSPPGISCTSAWTKMNAAPGQGALV